MANTLRIKRRSSAGAAGGPESLQNAELAFNEADNVLYYGTGTGGAGGSATSVIAIAGYGAYTTLGTTQSITGDKTFSGVVIVPTPSANTHAATKAYVDSALPTLTGTENQIVYNAGTISLAANVTTPGNLTVTGDLTVQGNTTTLNTSTLVVEDKNIVLANVASPTDTTADGAGFTIKGATDKTLNWVDATDAWTSSEHFNIVAGKSFYIGGSAVLSNTTLASSVVTSSLTSVGTIGTGVWQGTAVGIAYGGTGSTTAENARTALGLAIGSNVQAFSSQLTALAANTATIDGGTF
jgi:hypothetical protein